MVVPPASMTRRLIPFVRNWSDSAFVVPRKLAPVAFALPFNRQTVFPKESKSFRPDLKGYEVKTYAPNGTDVEASTHIPPAEASLQLNLTGPKTATVLWTDSNKIPAYAVILPGRITVPAGGEAIFELENLPNHPNLTLFGSFANRAESPKAKTYVRHNAVAVAFTDEDTEQAAAGNFVTKVFFIPENASGIDTIVSTRVDPGIDVLTEAGRRGDPIGVLRLGNRDAGIGANEDWHEKFLKGYLSRIEAERDQVQEELALLEEALIETSDESRREDILKKVAERKEILVQIDRRKEVYEQKLREHAESKGGNKAKAEKPESR